MLASHLDSLRLRYESAPARDPQVAQANFESYAEAVLLTAESLWESADASHAQRKKAAETILEIWNDRRELDPQAFDSLMTWIDRIQAEAPPDSDLIATAAYYRFLAIDASDASNLPTSLGSKLEATIQAALELGRARPPHLETPAILNRLGDEALAAGLDDQALALFTLLAEGFPEDPQGRRAAGLVRRLGGKGTVVDDIRGPTLDGGTLDIEDLRGRVALVVFWGTEWQLPEDLHLDAIKSYRDRFEPDDLAVVGVLFNTDFRRAAQFMTQYQVEWPQILAPANVEMRSLAPPQVALSYGIESSPTFMVLDREGRMTVIDDDFAQIEPVLNDLLGSSGEDGNPDTPQEPSEVEPAQTSDEPTEPTAEDGESDASPSPG